LRAVFLDRDGTINTDVNYLTKKSDIEIIDGVIEGLKKFKDLGYLNIIITNQSAVARGLITIEELESINDEIVSRLKIDGRKLIDDIFYSPYHPEGIISEFSIDSPDRKPGTGLLEKARDKYNLLLNQSFFIGDSFSDIECGKKAGTKTVLSLTGNGWKTLLICENRSIRPDYVAHNLPDAAQYVRIASEAFFPL